MVIHKVDHTSVLLKESLIKLNIKEDGIYVDATLGSGGHSAEILKRLKSGKLYCFDKDKDAIARATKKLEDISTNFEIFHSDFKDIDLLLKKGINKIDGIIFDLGVSSPQLDDVNRGFSFHIDSRLDMRMDQSQKISAWNIVNEYQESDLSKIFYEYGEDRFSNQIAKEIVRVREAEKINTTFELVEIIKKVKPDSVKNKKHPARQIFQALRIEVNNELDSIRTALLKSSNLLEINGKIVVITFHSLEDKIVKNIFGDLKNIKVETPYEIQSKFRTLKTVYSSEEEINKNRRSRSAKMRVIIKNY